METEIKIQDTPVTMRIVEADNDNEYSTSSYTDEDNGSVYEHSGVVRVLTDSELEEVNNELLDNIPRTPKRVTFGGEEVKMRTPDSDSVLQSDNDDLNRMARQLFEPPAKVDIVSEASTKQRSDAVVVQQIPQQVQQPRSQQPKARQQTPEKSIARPNTATLTFSTAQNHLIMSDNQTTEMRHKSASPIRQRRRHSFVANGLENMSLSPRATHKGIEVFHNLQRSPSISPNRSRRTSPEKGRSSADATSIDNKTEHPAASADAENLDDNVANIEAEAIAATESSVATMAVKLVSEATQTTTLTATHATGMEDNDDNASWKTLDLVDQECLHNLKSGVCIYIYYIYI